MRWYTLRITPTATVAGMALWVIDVVLPRIYPYSHGTPSEAWLEQATIETCCGGWLAAMALVAGGAGVIVVCRRSSSPELRRWGWRGMMRCALAAGTLAWPWFGSTVRESA